MFIEDLVSDAVALSKHPYGNHNEYDNSNDNNNNSDDNTTNNNNSHAKQ